MTNKPPNIIDRHGLAWALQDLADRMLQSGKQCTFEVPRTTVISNHNMEVLLLEIAEGALKFLIDRGEGEITRIELLRESGHAFLRVENDGVRGNKCLILCENLRMMRTYVSLFGGSLEIGSHGDGRTYVICTIPEETV